MVLSFENNVWGLDVRMMHKFVLKVTRVIIVVLGFMEWSDFRKDDFVVFSFVSLGCSDQIATQWKLFFCFLNFRKAKDQICASKTMKIKIFFTLVLSIPSLSGRMSNERTLHSNSIECNITYAVESNSRYSPSLRVSIPGRKGWI